jgi:hypothetical protein
LVNDALGSGSVAQPPWPLLLQYSQKPCSVLISQTAMPYATPSASLTTRELRLEAVLPLLPPLFSKAGVNATADEVESTGVGDLCMSLSHTGRLTGQTLDPR